MARGPSRAELRRRQLVAAADVEVPLYCDVSVVGGGAAGLVAGIAAADVGASVVVYERDYECGRTILATGAGRCNFANVQLDAARYRNAEFVSAVCGPAWLDDVLAFFHDSGLRWCEEEGRLYPASRQAASVRSVLLARARAAGVVLAPAREVVGVEFVSGASGGDDWVHEAGNRAHYDPRASETEPAGLAELAVAEAFDTSGALTLPGSRAVVLATGGEALLSLIDLGVSTERRRPVLCPLACKPSPLAELDGRRAHVEATLRPADGRAAWRERGEVLWRGYGLSGIVTFDLSRRTEPGDVVELDIAPNVSARELRALVDPAASGDFAPGALDGALDPQVAALLERLARQRWQPAWRTAPAPATDAEALVALVKALPFRVTGPAEPERAQVMRGGIAVSEVASETLALRRHPWLFACGEALDVDADCGGFNLAWAWMSALVAGAAAARWALS